MSQPTDVLRLALAQTAPTSADVAVNAAIGADVVRRAAARGAHVVVFPELFLAGYDLAALADGRARARLCAGRRGEVEDDLLADLVAAVSKTGAAALVGAAVLTPDGATTNSVVLVTPDRTTAVVAYDKQHLWDDAERALFRPGDCGATVELHGWRLGLGVCYDASFPEHARAAALDGVEAYVCPSAFLAGREHRSHIYHAARALENTVYSVFVNFGSAGTSTTYGGGTAAYGPDGRPHVGPCAAEEQLVTLELDRAPMAEARSFLRMLAQCSTHPERGRRQCA